MTRAVSPSLSRRLECVLGLLRPCSVLVDVGTDHGLLPVAAVCRGLAQRAIGVDRREAPLAGARALIERAGVASHVSAMLAEGLSGLDDRRVDAVVVAGMSAQSMLRIFELSPGVLARVQQLIVQPNQNVRELRAWALGNGWHLRDEHMLEERGQFFSVCSFSPGTGHDPAYAVPGWTERALCSVGPRLSSRKDAVALRWLERQRARLARLVERDASRRSELEECDAACRAMASA